MIVLFTCCDSTQNKFLQTTNEYTVLSKTETVGTHYSLFAFDKYSHNKIRTEYNIVVKQLGSNKVFVLKDVKIEQYYSMEKGKTYKISNEDMHYTYHVSLDYLTK